MSGTALSLLNALYGASDAGRVSLTDPVAALNLAERTKTKQVAAEAKQPEVALAISRFKKAVGAAKDVTALLKDPAVLEVLLTANGLGGQKVYPALARRALLSDASDPKSLANRLSNKAWKQTAATYDFAKKGLAVLKTPAVLATLTQGYAEVKWRQSLDAATPGLSNALTFIDRAATAKSVDAVLGDGTLRTVVTTALGIPAQIAFQTIEAQERAIGSRLDVKRLQDPKFVQTMARQYLIQKSFETGSSASSGLLL